MYAPLSAKRSRDRTKKGGIGRRPTLDLEGGCVAACFHDAAKENGDVFYLAFGEDWRMLTSEVRLWLDRGWMCWSLL